MRSKSVRGKCPRCLPDGGAIFHRGCNDKLERVLRCMNCHYEKKCRTRRNPPRETPSMLVTLNAMLNNERLKSPVLKDKKLIGNKLWFSLKETAAVNSLFAIMIYGTIGAKGKLDATYTTFGHTRKITDPVYLI